MYVILIILSQYNFKINDYYNSNAYDFFLFQKEVYFYRFGS